MKKENPGTEPVHAPVTAAPRQLQVERQGSRAVPVTRFYPQVRAGVCEYCGIIDPNVPSQFQYRLCPHYRGLQLRCSYCDEAKDPDEVAYRSVLNVHGHPDDPNKLVVVCDSFTCSEKHLQRFDVSR